MFPVTIISNKFLSQIKYCLNLPSFTNRVLSQPMFYHNLLVRSISLLLGQDTPFIKIGIALALFCKNKNDQPVRRTRMDQ